MREILMKRALVVLAALVLAGCGAAGTSHSVTDSSSTASSISKAASAAPAPDPTTTTEAPPRDLRASDLKPTLKISSKQCFGDAGCNIEANVRLAWVGSYRPADDDSYTVTYSISGVENGPQIGTIDITGHNKFDAPNELLSTPAHPKLAVTITDVEKTS